jgi:hypothetical protein
MKRAVDFDAETRRQAQRRPGKSKPESAEEAEERRLAPPF